MFFFSTGYTEYKWTDAGFVCWRELQPSSFRMVLNFPPLFLSSSSPSFLLWFSHLICFFYFICIHFNNLLCIFTRWLGEKYDGVRCYWDLPTQVAYPPPPSLPLILFPFSSLSLQKYILLSSHVHAARESDKHDDNYETRDAKDSNGLWAVVWARTVFSFKWAGFQERLLLLGFSEVHLFTPPSLLFLLTVVLKDGSIWYTAAHDTEGTVRRSICYSDYRDNKQSSFYRISAFLSLASSYFSLFYFWHAQDSNVQSSVLWWTSCKGVCRWDNTKGRGGGDLTEGRFALWTWQVSLTTEVEGIPFHFLFYLFCLFDFIICHFF